MRSYNNSRNAFSNSYPTACCNSYNKYTVSDISNPFWTNAANVPAVQAILAPQAAQTAQAILAPQAAQAVQAILAPQAAQTAQALRTTQAIRAAQAIWSAQADQTAQAIQPQAAQTAQALRTTQAIRAAQAIWSAQADQTAQAIQPQAVLTTPTNNADAESGNRQNNPGTVMNSATGAVGPLPVINTLLADPLNVVSVNINTSGMENPSVLLNFSSIVNLPLGISVTLNFEIARSLNGGAPVNVGSTYTFSSLVDILEAEAFSFQYFDAPLLPGFYTYSVRISTNSINDVTPGATVSNATLSALAVDRG